MVLGFRKSRDAYGIDIIRKQIFKQQRNYYYMCQPISVAHNKLLIEPHR
jgi:hypothetical protein